MCSTNISSENRVENYNQINLSSLLKQSKQSKQFFIKFVHQTSSVCLLHMPKTKRRPISFVLSNQKKEEGFEILFEKFKFWTEQVVCVKKLFKCKTFVDDLISQNFKHPVFLVLVCLLFYSNKP